MAPGLAARAAAAALLAGVLERRESLADLTAAEDGPLTRLAPADRARARTLATSVLRHLGRIDALLGRFLRKAPPPAARDALRIAVVEIHLDGVPAHAAVDGAVRLVLTHAKGKHVSGLVNAVARRVAEGGAALWDAVPEAPMPDWIADPVHAAWGADVLAAIEAAHLAPAPIDITLRGDTPEGLAADPLPTGSLRLRGRPRISALPGFAEGAWWVQDVAAALPARLLGPIADQRVLDLCAAPGGKTAQLAAAGGRVTALDISEPRLRRLRENLARTGLSAEIVVADALSWSPEAAFDAILLDAPCSATGTLRRHPDLPRLRTGRELAALTELQAALLARAWAMLRPGGRLVYCTCSLLPAEGEARIATFLGATPDARQLRPDPAPLGIQPRWLDAAGGLRTRPDYWAERGGMDGFYAALLEKSPQAA